MVDPSSSAAVGDDKSLPISESAQTSESQDPLDPKQWGSARRWTIAVILSCFTLISPMSSSMVAPALEDIARDTHIESDVTKQMVLSIFVLFLGLGPLLAGPLSELYGKVPVLQLGTGLYIVFNAAGGAARTPAQMLVFRAISGLGGGGPLGIGAAVLGDIFETEDRGKAVAVYNMAPLLGPSLGPLIGAAVTQYISWPWIFYLMSIVDFVLLAISLPLLKETYLPVLQARQQRKTLSNVTTSSTKAPLKRRLALFTSTLGQNLWRPLRMLFTQPLIQLLATFVSYLYGVMYLVLSTFPTLWVARYHEGIFIGGLNYLALSLGYFLGSQVCALCLDKIYRRLKSRNDGFGIPEFRLPLAMMSSILVPIGLIIYAWSAQYQLFWVVPDLGAVIFSMGVIIGLQCVTNYLIDTYSQYAASAMGAVTALRGLAGFAFPLFAPYMYAKLDYGWGNSLLAFVALSIGIAAPVALWFFGQRLRERSTFCSG